jgi:Cu2+-containing amine oxidase
MLVRATSTVLAGFLAGVLCATGVARAEDAPLDPLTAAEIATTFQVIEASEQFSCRGVLPDRLPQ